MRYRRARSHSIASVSRSVRRPKAGRVPVGRAAEPPRRRRRCGARGRSGRESLEPLELLLGHLALVAAPEHRECAQPAVLVEHGKRQPAAQTELVASLFFRGVPVGESDRPRVTAARREPGELARGLLGGEPVRGHERLAVGLREHEHGGGGLAHPRPPRAPAATNPSESAAPASAETPQPVELAVCARRGCALRLTSSHASAVRSSARVAASSATETDQSRTEAASSSPASADTPTTIQVVISQLRNAPLSHRPQQRGPLL
jgi:hypothetical protein